MKKLTFCLLLTVFVQNTLASNSQLKSLALKQFDTSIKEVKVIEHDFLPVCEVTQADDNFLAIAKKVTPYYVSSSKDLSEFEIKNTIEGFEKLSPEFWKASNNSFKQDKLLSFEESLASGIFKNKRSIFDNLYCFAYLGADFKELDDHKKMVEAIKKVQELTLYVYYDDSFDNDSDTSILISYLIDKSTNEIYALKGLQK